MKKVVLVHFGRSGSTVFAKMIEAATDVVWLHETYSLIWQGMENKADYNFDCAYMVDIAKKGVERGARPSTRLIGLEAKLINFIHSGNCTMQQYVQAMKAQGDWEVVTLMRRNVLARVLSIYRAAESGVWHIKKETSAGKRRSTAKKTSKDMAFSLPMSDLFDPDTGVRGDNLVDFLRNVQKREAHMMTNLHKECDVALELVYEDHVREDPSTAHNMFRKTFDLPATRAKVGLNKTGGDVRKELKNFDKVQAALQGTDFEWMIDDL